MSQLLLAKILHIFFVISWFAGIFYLPRLFVNHAMARDACEQQLLTGMEARLIRMMNFTAVFVILTGSWLLYLQSGGFQPGYFRQQGWIHAKITLVIILLAYHYWCIRIHRQFAAGTQKHSHVWFRWFNEMPVFVLLAILWLVLAKPF
jgi:putative membrane protein